jgi:uncharacterized repeat protein (TIGR03803 family)
MDSAGNLYGTTAYGGASASGCSPGYGTVFKLSPTGTETILHFFAGGTTDGQNPQGALVMDSAGNLYGTTQYGGAGGSGTVFKIAPDGTESLLYSFDGNYGANPLSGVILDSAGNLYGTTDNGSVAHGAVFKLTPGGVITDLYSFTGGTNSGSNPQGGLIMDNTGNFYGTTYFGGVSNNGTVFKLSPSGTLTVLYSFAGGTADGSHPQTTLVMDSAGNLFGTTHDGGAASVGTVFMVSATGVETVLHSFGGNTADGGNPEGSLVLDNAGNLYGTTVTYGQYGIGTVFKIN